MDCYIYYKSAAQHREQVLACVAQLQTHLALQLAIPMHLQQRPAKDDFVTWMEIYRDIGPDFNTNMAKALNQCALQDWLIGERRMEYFVDVETSWT